MDYVVAPPTGQQLFRQSERELDVLRGGCARLELHAYLSMSDCVDPLMVRR